MLKNVKFFVIIQEWLKGCAFRTTQDLIILSSLTILWNCYYDLLTENMSTEYSRKSNWKKSYFITGLENKLRTIRRKYKMHGRTKIIVWTMCCQFTSYQFEETLRAFIKTNLDFADQENVVVVVRDLILEVNLKIYFRKLVSRSDSKFFLLKTNWSGKLLSRQVGRTIPDGSLDMRHLIIILTKIRCCKWCYCDFCHLSIC
jgi:hypothetical protein